MPRLVPILEDISTQLPPQRNLSNGKIHYGVVVSPCISLATMEFRETADDMAVTAVFYKTKKTSAAIRGNVLSGEHLREEKLEIIPGDKEQEVTGKGWQNLKSFQCSVRVPSGIVDVARNVCYSCHTEGSESDSDADDSPADSSKVVVILYEGPNLFTDALLEPKNLSLIPPVLGVAVSGRDGHSVPLPNLPQNITVNFSIANIRNVSTVKSHDIVKCDFI